MLNTWCALIFQNQGCFPRALSLKRSRWPPCFFFISDTSNSLSDCSKNLKESIDWKIFARTSLILLLVLLLLTVKVKQTFGSNYHHRVLTAFGFKPLVVVIIICVIFPNWNWTFHKHAVLSCNLSFDESSSVTCQENICVRPNNSIYLPKGNSALHLGSLHITFLQLFIFSQYPSDVW